MSRFERARVTYEVKERGMSLVEAMFPPHGSSAIADITEALGEAVGAGLRQYIRQNGFDAERVYCFELRISSTEGGRDE